jgi:hypothetical protein
VVQPAIEKNNNIIMIKIDDLLKPAINIASQDFFIMPLAQMDQAFVSISKVMRRKKNHDDGFSLFSFPLIFLTTDRASNSLISGREYGNQHEVKAFA